MGDFQVILAAILSPDNSTRTQAEEQFNKLPVELKLPHLVSTMRTEGASEEVKSMAAVLLRRMFLQLEYKDIVKDVPGDVLQATKVELLMSLQMEPSAHVRRKICDAVAEMARSCLDDNDINQWPELLKFLFQCCNPDQPYLYQSALHIISVFPSVFGNQLTYCIDAIKQLLIQALNSSDKEVCSEAFKATVAFVIFLDSQSIRGGFADLLPLLVAVIGTDGVEDGVKQLAFELVVTVSENAPAMIRKHSKFFPRIVTQGLQFMLQVEDDEEWLNIESADDDEDSSSNAVVGETSLDRLANALGGKAILPHIISNIPQMLQSKDWRYRHAALMAISAVGEGCQKQMTLILSDVVTAVLPFLPGPSLSCAVCCL